MKKLLVIICILLLIFVGMYIYKNNANQNIVTVSEVESIEEYFSKIYMWEEITQEALPKFDDINNAPDLWIWESVKKNLEDYELTYEQIVEKAKELFGENFSRQFPKEGTEYIIYNEGNNRYLATGTGLDSQEDSFFINKISKIKNGYKVEVIEYLEDYSESLNIADDEEIYNVYIKNLNNETIATINSKDSEQRAIEIVKENINSFTKKIVILEKDSNGKVHIKSVE